MEDYYEEWDYDDPEQLEEFMYEEHHDSTNNNVGCLIFIFILLIPIIF
jgi:hypothetical protein|tara:strand:+ start:3709 stop:3852 length:144 start_codon:yes stop_codon:yes gene_type:complete